MAIIMKKNIYILLFSVSSLNAQQIDSIGLNQNKSENKITISKDFIIENDAVTHKKNDEKSKIVNNTNKERFWGIAIAIIIGLIPLMIQIWYSLREYKKSQIDKYGSFIL